MRAISQREEPDLNDITKLGEYLPLESANSHSELACKVIEWAIKTGIRIDDPPGNLQLGRQWA